MSLQFLNHFLRLFDKFQWLIEYLFNNLKTFIFAKNAELCLGRHRLREGFLLRIFSKLCLGPTNRISKLLYCDQGFWSNNVQGWSKLSNEQRYHFQNKNQEYLGVWRMFRALSFLGPE